MARGPLAEGLILPADAVAVGVPAPTLLEVQFTRRYEKYNQGERVNLPPATARQMVDLGVAQRSGLPATLMRTSVLSDPAAMIRK